MSEPEQPPPGAGRRRRRAARPGEAFPVPGPAATSGTGGASPPRPNTEGTERTEGTDRGDRHDRRDRGERALRDLIGAGPSQLGVDKALRARDVNRPTEQDLAAAEQELTIVRRNWRPPAPGD